MLTMKDIALCLLLACLFGLVDVSSARGILILDPTTTTTTTTEPTITTVDATFPAANKVVEIYEITGNPNGYDGVALVEAQNSRASRHKTRPIATMPDPDADPQEAAKSSANTLSFLLPMILSAIFWFVYLSSSSPEAWVSL